MTTLVSWSDVFVVGIGFDIAGAYLLAKGLLMSDRQVRGLARTYWGASPDQVVARVDDRIAGRVGVVALVAGFACQLFGYFINSSITNLTGNPSMLRGLVTIAVAAGAISVVNLVYRAILPGYRRRSLIQLARYDNDLQLKALPYGAFLIHYGNAAGMPPPHGDESQTDYARRVWKVSTITEGGPPE